MKPWLKPPVLAGRHQPDAVDQFRAHHLASANGTISTEHNVHSDIDNIQRVIEVSNIEEIHRLVEVACELAHNQQFDLAVQILSLAEPSNVSEYSHINSLLSVLNLRAQHYEEALVDAVTALISVGNNQCCQSCSPMLSTARIVVAVGLARLGYVLAAKSFATAFQSKMNPHLLQSLHSPMLADEVNVILECNPLKLAHYSSLRHVSTDDLNLHVADLVTSRACNAVVMIGLLYYSSFRERNDLLSSGDSVVLRKLPSSFMLRDRRTLALACHLLLEPLLNRNPEETLRFFESEPTFAAQVLAQSFSDNHQLTPCLKESGSKLLAGMWLRVSNQLRRELVTTVNNLRNFEWIADFLLDFFVFDNASSTLSCFAEFCRMNVDFCNVTKEAIDKLAWLWSVLLSKETPTGDTSIDCLWLKLVSSMIHRNAVINSHLWRYVIITLCHQRSAPSTELFEFLIALTSSRDFPVNQIGFGSALISCIAASVDVAGREDSVLRLSISMAQRFGSGFIKQIPSETSELLVDLAKSSNNDEATDFVSLFGSGDDLSSLKFLDRLRITE